MFTRTLSVDTAQALAILSKSGTLGDAYLAGGTSLALHLGHRISIDLDFFSPSKFVSKEIIEKLKLYGNYIPQQQTDLTINGVFNDVKFSYFYYPYQLIGSKVDFEGIKLSSIKDIAAMKLAAITGRGTKKDYIDLYFLAKKYTFEDMFSFYEMKFQMLNANLITILKSMSYFYDADESEMPIMIDKVSWSTVKDFFTGEVKRLSKIYL